MRCFVALELPASVPAELARRAAVAASSCPSARWLRSEAMHVTVAFLGSIDEAMLPTIDKALQPVFTAAPRLEARFDGLGAFPPRGKARVVWSGFDTRPDGALGQLHRQVTRTLAELEDADGNAIYEPETRPYRPHVTLAYCRPPWPRSAVETLATEMDGPTLTGTIDRGALFESILEPSGAHYRVVSAYPLRMATDVKGIVR